MGDKAIDDHSMRSTLKGETADMVNKFRELKLREYCDITKLCKLNGIILSERLLEKGKCFYADNSENFFLIHRTIFTHKGCSEEHYNIRVITLFTTDMYFNHGFLFSGI